MDGCLLFSCFDDCSGVAMDGVTVLLLTALCVVIVLIVSSCFPLVRVKSMLSMSSFGVSRVMLRYDLCNVPNE